MCVPCSLDPTATIHQVGYKCMETCLKMFLDHCGHSCSLAAICQLTRPGLSGTSIEALLDAARRLGAPALSCKRVQGRRQACRFLGEHVPLIAFVSPSKLYSRGIPRRERWVHAVVVLKQEGSSVIYHDPDGIYGGPCQSRSMAAFLDAWGSRRGSLLGRYDFTALVVRRDEKEAEADSVG